MASVVIALLLLVQGVCGNPFISIIILGFVCVCAVKSSAGDVGLVEGEVLNGPGKQLSIIAPSKKRVHGKLQKHIQVRLCMQTEHLFWKPFTSYFIVTYVGAWQHELSFVSHGQGGGGAGAWALAEEASAGRSPQSGPP